MSQLITAYPAYGRRYSTKELALEQFKTEKDFSASLRGGPYFSIRDFQKPHGHLAQFDGIQLYWGSPEVNRSVTVLRAEFMPTCHCGATLPELCMTHCAGCKVE